MTTDSDLAGLATTVAPLRVLFDAEPDRLARMAFDVAGIYFDFSKLAASAIVIERLQALAVEAGFDAWRERLFAGAIVNLSENRAATHIAERGSGNAADNAAADEGQAAMQTLVADVRSGDVTDIIHIGIGGSALGPALLLDALGRDGTLDADGPCVHIVANIDGEALARAVMKCDPARTLIVIVSKTFTTTETMTNADSALEWLAAHEVTNPRGRTIAVTAAPEKARAWGAGAVLPFAETVGGR